MKDRIKNIIWDEVSYELSKHCPVNGSMYAKWVVTECMNKIDKLKPTLSDVLSKEQIELIRDVLMQSVVCKTFIKEKLDKIEQLAILFEKEILND